MVIEVIQLVLQDIYLDPYNYWMVSETLTMYPEDCQSLHLDTMLCAKSWNRLYAEKSFAVGVITLIS